MVVQFANNNTDRVISAIGQVAVGEKVVVRYHWGEMIGTVVQDAFSEEDNSTGNIIRRATVADLEKINNHQPEEKRLEKIIRQKIKESGLVMKVVNVSLTLDERCVVVSFTADSRVDFRELVREITAATGKFVRFQQAGARDEAKRLGGIGICGRELCCTLFSQAISSVTTEMARCQSVAHRGSERLSGLCGRLMCCLAYESQQYQECGADMPQKGEKFIWQGKEVSVVDVLVLDRKVKVRDKDGQISITNLEELKQ